jgi:hypothetical protein
MAERFITTGAAFLAVVLLAADALADGPALNGRFTGRDGHGAAGTVTLHRQDGRVELAFSSTFKVTLTNRVRIGFGRHGRLDPATLTTPLPALAGAQRVMIAAGYDPARHTEIWLWCDQHSSEAGVARLR